MWRDPLDELIDELERIVPEQAPPKPKGFDPVAFQMEAEQLDQRIERERQQACRGGQEGSGAGTGVSAVIPRPPLDWPVRPARRIDPSAPWDHASQTDWDDTEG